MSKALELAKYYFNLSNQSDFSKIEVLFDDNSTFCTPNLDYFIGVDNIMLMQRKNHGSYKKLNWEVTMVEEVKSGVIRFEFNFKGVNQNDESIQFSGIEYVIVRNNIIRHIDVQINKKI